jgi:hypothetical protein
MAQRRLFSLGVAAVWLGSIVVIGSGNQVVPILPGACAPEKMTPLTNGEGLPLKIHESWPLVMLCLKDLVKAGQELNKVMKIASWKNNRYRQVFEPAVNFWGYIAGVPWGDDGEQPEWPDDSPLGNLVRNSDYDGMKALKFSTDQVEDSLGELDYYAGVKPKKKRSWYHPPAEVVDTEGPPTHGSGKTPGNGERGDEEERDGDIVPEVEQTVPENRANLISTKPVGRSFSDFFWHPKPEHVDIHGKEIVHGEQIEKMLPDQRLDGHGYNPELVWTEHQVPLRQLGSRRSEPDSRVALHDKFK